MGDRGMVSEALVSGETVDVEPSCSVATCLKISVLNDGRPIVQVSFPAYAIVNLADLVPEEARPWIAAHALDLEDLAARCAAQGLPTGELFSVPGPDNTVRAWME
jgi:hypothetical protein